MKLISNEERLTHLAEEVHSILSESVFSARLTLLEARHLVGQTIVENELYQKNQKGSGELIKQISDIVGRSDREIYFCVEFYNSYPKIEQLVQTLGGKKNDITWSAVKRLLSGKEEVCSHEWKETTSWQCEKCNQYRKHKPLDK